MSIKNQNSLRNMTNIRVYKNISNPVMFLGYPLKLAYFYIGSIVLGAILGLILNTLNVGFVINIGFPVFITFMGITAVSWFYNKYGINGYELSQRNNNLFQNIESSASILDEIRNKINNNGKA